jgi:hypothetical protein
MVARQICTCFIVNPHLAAAILPRRGFFLNEEIQSFGEMRIILSSPSTFALRDTKNIKGNGDCYAKAVRLFVCWNVDVDGGGLWKAGETGSAGVDNALRR